MRRAVVVLCAVAAVAVPLAPARAAGVGTIEGFVVNETNGRRQEGVRVTLLGGRADGSDRIERVATTDARGRYRFGRLPTGDDRFYVVDAAYRGGLFPGSPVSLPATSARPPVIRTRLKVWETTRDPRTILIARDNIFLAPGEGTVDVVESVTLANMTDRAYIGRGAESGAPTASLPLPEGARGGGVEILDSELDVPRLVATDTGAGLTIAIPPGQWRFTYAYRVPGTAGAHDLSRSALYPVVAASVHGSGEIDVVSNRLVENGEVTIEGVAYRRWSATEAIEEGSSLQITATIGGAPAGSAAALAVAGALVAGLLAATFWRAGRSRRRGAAAKPEPQRDDLLHEIAALDIRRDSGELDEEEWRARRAALLSRLREPEGAR